MPITGGTNKPRWSIYDICNNPEHDLAESLVTEYSDISGIEIDYYVRDDSIIYDTLYGEHTMTGYQTPKRTKIIYDVGEEPNLWNSWGMFGGDITTVQMPQLMFRRDVSYDFNPKIGDAISILWYPGNPGTTGSLIDGREFEIVHVDDDDKVFSLKKLIWILVLRPFRFSEQSQSAEDITESHPLSAYGDNEWIISESEEIDDILDDGYYNVN